MGFITVDKQRRSQPKWMGPIIVKRLFDKTLKFVAPFTRYFCTCTPEII